VNQKEGRLGLKAGLLWFCGIIPKEICAVWDPTRTPEPGDTKPLLFSGAPFPGRGREFELPDSLPGKIEV